MLAASAARMARSAPTGPRWFFFCSRSRVRSGNEGTARERVARLYHYRGY
jgi:hypothetical protein